MKKLLVALALGAFAACNSSTPTEVKMDSVANVVDSSTDAKIDSMKSSTDSITDKMDSASDAKVDSLKK